MWGDPRIVLAISSLKCPVDKEFIYQEHNVGEKSRTFGSRLPSDVLKAIGLDEIASEIIS